MKFSQKHHIYERLVRKKAFLREASDLVKQRISPEQLQKLNLIDEEDSYNLYEQMFLRYIDNRYHLNKSKEEILGEIENFLDKYKFLLETKNLDPLRVRNIFISGLMDTISSGSGVYFLWGDTGYDQFGNQRFSSSIPGIKSFKFGEIYKKGDNIFQKIDTKYSSIPKEQCFCYVIYADITYYITKTLANQLWISHAYPIYKLCKRKEFKLKNLEQEFLRRIRWYLQRLTRCHLTFVNKYKECVCREISYCLGMDADRCYRVFFHRLRSSLKNVDDCKYKEKRNILEYIVNCFSKEELELLAESDLIGNLGSFRKQLEDRYYSKYPSLASTKEIKIRIKEIVKAYKSCLNKENLEIIKDSLLQEIEREAFVSLPTHLGNLEMEKNLITGKIKFMKPAVVRAINLIISSIPKLAIEQLKIEINQINYDLKQQLSARYRRAWFGSSLNSLKKYLSFLHIYTPYSPKNGKDKGNISRVDLQSFLEEVDMFFLYPEKGRIAKKLFLGLDNGRALGANNLKRLICLRIGYPHFNITNILTTVFIAVFLIIMVTSIICF